MLFALSKERHQDWGQVKEGERMARVNSIALTTIFHILDREF